MLLVLTRFVRIPTAYPWWIRTVSVLVYWGRHRSSEAGRRLQRWYYLTSGNLSNIWMIRLSSRTRLRGTIMGYQTKIDYSVLQDNVPGPWWLLAVSRRKDMAPDGSALLLQYLLRETRFCNDLGLLNLRRSSLDVLISTSLFYFSVPAAVPGWSVWLFLHLLPRVLGQSLRHLFPWPVLLLVLG